MLTTAIKVIVNKARYSKKRDSEYRECQRAQPDVEQGFIYLFIYLFILQFLVREVCWSMTPIDLRSN